MTGLVVVDGNGASKTIAGVTYGSGNIANAMVISDATTEAQKVAVGSSGALSVDIAGANVATYLAAFSASTPGAAATDFLTVRGSSTSTIEVLDISLSGHQSAGAAAAITDILAFKRTAANIGGTTTSVTPVGCDSLLDAATGAQVALYSVNPTTLGAGGLAAASQMSFEASSAVAPQIKLDFASLGAQPLRLRGVTELLALNLNGATVSGTISGTIRYRERKDI